MQIIRWVKVRVYFCQSRFSLSNLPNPTIFAYIGTNSNCHVLKTRKISAASDDLNIQFCAKIEHLNHISTFQRTLKKSSSRWEPDLTLGMWNGTVHEWVLPLPYRPPLSFPFGS